MSIATKHSVATTQGNRSFCQPIETLESRQMLSATVPHIPAFLPQFQSNADQSNANVHAGNGHHSNKGHGTSGNGSLITTAVLNTKLVSTIFHPIPVFLEPKVNSDVTQWHNFSSNPLFAAGGPSANDVAQGQVGDCWFLATLAETALRDPTTIKNAIHQRADGTYDVVFHTSPTTTVNEHVDGLLPETVYGSLEYAKLGQGGCTWVAIMEKAFTYFRNRSIAADYATISSGWGREAMSDLGASPTEQLPTTANASQLFSTVVWGLIFNSGMEFGTNGTSGPLVNGHEYSVVSARVQGGVNQIEVRNPWGYNPGYVHGSSNYDATNDGYMWVNASAVFGELDEFVTAGV
ncbi:MAG TPA: C2 family cysteine protease [Humisphaera sp.]|jgi:hypothetical protein|nr:C2 family cysteine protease [Humisphaera sp.]